jgi:hypothetical protein
VELLMTDKGHVMNLTVYYGFTLVVATCHGI